MTNNKATKRALLSSVMALFLCFAMLMGTTFAWFTDVVSSEGNVIKTGTLDVGLTWTDDFDADESAWNDVEPTDANPNPEKIFDYTLWEPGYTQVRYLKVENKGSLALKYKLQIITESALTETVENYGDVRLSDVIDVYYATSKVEVPDRILDENANLRYLGTLTDFVNAGAVINDNLLAGEADYATLVLQMQTSAGNEYQNLTVGTSFDIRLFATQYTHEVDSFDDQYDAGANFEGTSSVVIDNQQVATEIVVLSADGRTKIGTILVQDDSYAASASQLDATIVKSNYTPNITVAAGSETLTVDISVAGVKEDNDVPMLVELFIGEGLDPDTVKVYHYDEEIVGVDGLPNYVTRYTPSTGYVRFYTKSFSPFTIEYDAESEYTPSVEFVPGTELPANCPTPNVSESPNYVNTDLAWGNYGDWTPTEGLDNKLEAAFTFSCPETDSGEFDDWYCDFYVKLDEDLGENQIFLGGNYGSFGWVGFHNGNFTLDANTEIGLLESVTTNPWTYGDVKSFVGTFICGVGDVNDALTGATFTVMLRLTNPENEAEYYNVYTVNYTFSASTVSE